MLITDVFVLNNFLQQEKNEPHKIKKVLQVFFKSIDNEVFSNKSNKQLRKVCLDWGTKKLINFTSQKILKYWEIQVL